jgi:acetyl esterase
LLRTDEVIYHVADGQPLAATLYRPAAVPRSAIVSVHGGRWCSETRLTNAVIDRALAEAGTLVMAIDFRQPPSARYPGPVADINLAIRWFKHHAANYGVDATKIGGIGTSSGGHQLLLNALKPGFPAYASWPMEGAPDAGLAFVVACWPVLDPPARYRFAIDRGMQRHIESHDAYWTDVQAMSDGSPQRIVTDGEASHLPPILLIQGTADDVLPADMADRFADAYRAAGGRLQLEKYPGQPHTFITKNPDGEASVAAIRRIEQFISNQAANSPA